MKETNNCDYLIETKDNLIKQRGEVIEYKTAYYSYKKCDNIKTIVVEGEKVTHLINPTNDENNIYLMRIDNNFSSEQEISNIKWPENVEKDQIKYFVEEMNFRLNEDNEFKPFLKRDDVMKFCGISLFVIFIIFCLCFIATGIYVQVILSNGTDLTKIDNNFKKTPSFIYFLLSAFLLAMAIYLLIICYFNNDVKEYEKNKYFFDLYKEKLEYFIKEWDILYFKDKKTSVEITMNLEYIHICLDINKKAVIQEFII